MHFDAIYPSCAGATVKGAGKRDMWLSFSSAGLQYERTGEGEGDKDDMSVYESRYEQTGTGTGKGPELVDCKGPE